MLPLEMETPTEPPLEAIAPLISVCNSLASRLCRIRSAGQGDRSTVLAIDHHVQRVVCAVDHGAGGNGIRSRDGGLLRRLSDVYRKWCCRRLGAGCSCGELDAGRRGLALHSKQRLHIVETDPGHFSTEDIL